MKNKSAFIFTAVGNRPLVQGALLTIVFALLLALPLCAGAQTPAVTLAPTINTVVGNYSLGSGYSGDGLAPTAATLNSPQGIAFDPFGNLYIADTKNNVIRQVNAGTQTIITFAGNGTSGYSGNNGPATAAQLAGPTGVASDALGNIFIADLGNNVIRRVDVVTQNITTVAGGGTPATGKGDGGPAIGATLSSPSGVAFDAAGNLFIADFGNNEIRRVDAFTHIITKLAGGGTPASGIGDGGPAISAILSAPRSVATDAAGNIYIADMNHNVVRQVNATTLIITTVAGNYLLDPGYSGDSGLATSAQLNKPTGLAIDAAGNLYISDQSNEVVRAVNPATQMIVTVAGNNLLSLGYSGDGGVAIGAQLNSPAGLIVDASGNLYIADASNNVIREVNAVKGSIKFPTTSVLAVSAPQNLVLQLNAAVTITSVSANASQGPVQEYAVRTVTNCATDGVTLNPAGSNCTVAVTFNPAYPGERDVPLTVVTSAGNFNFGLSGIGTGPQVALIPGTITTVAGIAPAPISDSVRRAARTLKTQFKANALVRRRAVRPADAPATGEMLNFPNGVAVDSASNLYIADSSNSLVWKVDASGNATVVAGGGIPASGNGDGGPAINAQLAYPETVCLDGAGNLYIADTASIRKVDANTGYISTVAGGGNPASGNGDGGPATNAALSGAYGVAVDRSGNIYIADFYDVLIRKVDANTGYISTVAGGGTNDYTVNGVAAASALLNQPYGVSVDSVGNYYISDDGDSVVRRVDASTGLINTIVGNGQSGYSGDGGPAINAQIYSIGYTAVDGAGNLYIADYGNDVIRKVDASTGIINTIAGNSNGGYSGDGGAATSATLNQPDGIAVDSVGNLYIADSDNNLVREVTASAATLIFPTPTATGTIDATDGAQAVTVSNIGNLPLTFAPNVLSNAVLSGSSCLLSLPSGTTCVENIEFIPNSPGPVSGYVSLVDNALNAVPPANTQTIILNGSGTGAASTLFSVSGPSTTVAGTPQSFTVTALAGNTGTNTGYLGTVHFTSTDVIAILPSDYTFTPADNGVHVFSVVLATAGTQTVTVTDTTTSSAAGTSNTVTVSAGPAAQVSAVSGSGQSAVIGAAFTNPLTVMVTDAYGNPVAGAAVTFTAPATGASATLGSATVNTDSTGKASTTATANGIAGSYGVSASIHGLTPTTFSLTNSKAPNTSVALSSSPSTDYFGQTLTFTAKVTNAAGTPDGTVGFYDGSTLLGSGTLSTGTATYATSSLAVGTHSITAVYAGSANFVGATSSAQSETVTASAISLPSSSALGTVTLSQGGTGKTQFTIGSLGTLNGAISLACSGLPAGLGCQLSPSSVPLSTLPASVTITINSTQVTSARNSNHRLAPLGWALAMMLPGMLLVRRNRKLRMTMLAIALGLLLLGLASCGGGSSSTPVSNSYTPVGNYTGTITATSTGAATTTTTFSVNLQQ